MISTYDGHGDGGVHGDADDDESDCRGNDQTSKVFRLQCLNINLLFEGSHKNLIIIHTRSTQPRADNLRWRHCGLGRPWQTRGRRPSGQGCFHLDREIEWSDFVRFRKIERIFKSGLSVSTSGEGTWTLALETVVVAAVADMTVVDVFCVSVVGVVAETSHGQHESSNSRDGWLERVLRN